MNPVTCICLFYQNFEDEKTVSQIGGASEVCDQNGERVFIFYIFFIKLIEDADDDRICLSIISSNSLRFIRARLRMIPLWKRSNFRWSLPL